MTLNYIKNSYPGINIQFPFSEWIASGLKKIETRTYDLPEKYIGKDLLIIETPGRSERFQARAIGLVRFSGSKFYKSKSDFVEDLTLHLVDSNSEYMWRREKPKWGWIVESASKFDSSKKISGKRGIVFAKHLKLIE